jgi:hypothetical protein
MVRRKAKNDRMQAPSGSRAQRQACRAGAGQRNAEQSDAHACRRRRSGLQASDGGCRTTKNRISFDLFCVGGGDSFGGIYLAVTKNFVTVTKMGKLQPGTVVEFTYYGTVHHGKVEEWDIVSHEYTVKYYIDGKLCLLGVNGAI